jgi:hypothetical protein
MRMCSEAKHGGELQRLSAVLEHPRLTATRYQSSSIANLPDPHQVQRIMTPASPAQTRPRRSRLVNAPSVLLALLLAAANFGQHAVSADISLDNARAVDRSVLEAAEFVPTPVTTIVMSLPTPAPTPLATNFTPATPSLTELPTPDPTTHTETPTAAPTVISALLTPAPTTGTTPSDQESHGQASEESQPGLTDTFYIVKQTPLLTTKENARQSASIASSSFRASETVAASSRSGDGSGSINDCSPLDAAGDVGCHGSSNFQRSNNENHNSSRSNNGGTETIDLPQPIDSAAAAGAPLLGTGVCVVVSLIGLTAW